MHIRLFPLLTFFSLVAAVGAEIILEPMTSRRIEINALATQTWVQDGRIAFELVAGPSPAAKMAAEEASELLGRMFAAKIPVLRQASGDLPALILGDRELAAKNGIDPETFDRDGFVIKTLGRDVLIIGRDDKQRPPSDAGGTGLYPECGTLYGTYDFLERFAGVRFYFPGDIGTVTPRKPNWRLPQIDIADRPDFPQRRFYDVCYGKSEKFMPEGLEYPRDFHTNHLRVRLGTLGLTACHGLAYLGYVQRFGKTHPEYFAMKSNGERICDPNDPIERNRTGHLCFSSDIKQEVILDAIAFLTGQSAESRGVLDFSGKPRWTYSRFPTGLPSFDISPNDALVPCLCEKCQKFRAENSNDDNKLLWNFFIDVAEALQQQGIPGYVSTSAYGNFKSIPERKIPSNLLCEFALGGPWQNGTPSGKSSELLLAAWKEKLGQRLWTWVYVYRPATRPHIPHLTPRAVVEFYQRIKPWSMGGFMEAGTQQWLHGYLTTYAFAKVAWDNDLDVSEMLAEHHRLMFATAAAPMQEFYESIERNWLKTTQNLVETPLGPTIIPPSDEEIWGKIYSPEEMSRLESLLQQARQLVAGDPEALRRVEYITAEIWQPVLDSRTAFNRTRNDKLYWRAYLADSPEKAREVYLVSRKDLPIEVKTTVKPYYDDEFFCFAFECQEPHTDKMTFIQREFDDPDIWRDSTVEIFLNPSCDRKGYYQILVNPAGSFSDLRRSFEKNDWSWNSGATVKTSIIPGEKWLAEIKVPRSSLEPMAGQEIVANFSRFRVLNQVPFKTAEYDWSFYTEKFSDAASFGTLTCQDEESQNILQDGDFRLPVNGRFLGEWASNVPVYRDEQCFLTGGGSVRLQPDSPGINQHFTNLKPNTAYRLSFYLRLQEVKPLGAGGGFSVRMDEGSGKVNTFPLNRVYGTFTWTRQEFSFTTGEQIGSRSKPYLRFSLHNTEGTAWVDHVQLCEAP